MKTTILSVLMMATFAISCKKSIDTPAHQKEWYRVLAVGQDTTTSTAMNGRTETSGLITAEDSKLRAELVGYKNGVYTIMVTNKQSCDVTINWGWDGLTINNITPSSNIVAANSFQVFTLTGTSKVGSIKLQAKGDCGNSSTLIVNITADILPITYLYNTIQYNQATNKTSISFMIDDPTKINWIVIQKLVATEWKQVMLIGCDHTTQSYSIDL